MAMEDKWNALPQQRRDDIISLLVMESEGGGWVPNEMFESDPKEVEEQIDAIRALVEHLGFNSINGVSSG